MTISKDEELAMYRAFLHDINMYASICMDSKKVGKLISNACAWSYSHRVGNGMLSDEEQQEIIDRSFLKLRDVD